MTPRRRLIVACALTFTATVAPALALAAGTVGSAQINASVLPLDVTNAVLPLDVTDAVLPIELKSAVIPLEAESTHGATSVITVSSDVLFAFDKAALTPQALRTIANLAGRIPHRPGLTVHVDGYTDSIGTSAYNQTLSQHRAAAVAAALKRDLGAGAPAIDARGHGEANPVAPNEVNGKDNPPGRAKNRRVTIAFPHG